MSWIRNISLVRRVTIGFICTAAITAGMGAGGVWAVQGKVEPRTAVWAIGIVSVAGCLFSLVAGLLIRASIKDSVESTVQCVVRIAGGDLETPIESPGKDEISWLRAELNSMRKKLRKTVLSVRDTVASVNVASEEIASGNLDLSNRTEDQSIALQKTANSMEQLASAVQSNARSTHEARAVVTLSSEIVARGESTMRNVIVRMGEINRSATQITDIVGVIDGIAFQTNILALNAAVEAARAGEHGRGFAVVAAEVRNLAQRSSTAAREIKSLIGDSTRKVEAGSELVDSAGAAMKEILGSVNRVAGLIAEIADAGQSQSSGIAEIHQAIGQIDTMTQQNAALVEELAAAAQSLKGQSGQLTESMSSFHVVG